MFNDYRSVKWYGIGRNDCTLSCIHIILYPRLKFTRFLALHITHKFTNGISNSCHNGRIIMDLITIILTCVCVCKVENCVSFDLGNGMKLSVLHCYRNILA
jgi:hypothetical protein